MSDEELEEIRRRKMAQLQAEAQQRAAVQEQHEKIEAQKTALLRTILTPEARTRLNSIKMVKPQFAEGIELQLIQLAQSGQLSRMGISIPITDEHLKMILSRAQGKKRDMKIQRI
ncbi:MAG: DNA-binding protein [Candidatus Helarchaeota archaeon]